MSYNIIELERTVQRVLFIMNTGAYLVAASKSLPFLNHCNVAKSGCKPD